MSILISPFFLFIAIRVIHHTKKIYIFAIYTEKRANSPLMYTITNVNTITKKVTQLLNVACRHNIKHTSKTFNSKAKFLVKFEKKLVHCFFGVEMIITIW